MGTLIQPTLPKPSGSLLQFCSKNYQMLSFKDYFSESTLSRPELIKPAGSGPNSGLPRYEIFANKIWKSEEHILNDGNTIVIKTIALGGNEYKSSNPKDKQKFINDFAETDGEGIKIIDPSVSMTNKVNGLSKTPEYGGRGGCKKISESTQEIMTCAVVLLNKQFNEEEITVEEKAQLSSRFLSRIFCICFIFSTSL